MRWTPALVCLRLQFSLTRACIPHLFPFSYDCCGRRTWFSPRTRCESPRALTLSRGDRFSREGELGLAWRLTGPGVAGNPTSTPAPAAVELGGGIGSRSLVDLSDGVLSADDRVRAQSALRIVRHSVLSDTLSALASVEMSSTNEENWLILFGGPKLGNMSASCFRG
jgi:hypothetical protein